MICANFSSLWTFDRQPDSNNFVAKKYFRLILSKAFKAEIIRNDIYASTNVASVQSFNGTHWFREASLFGGIGVPASQQGLLIKLALMFDILS